MIDDEVAKPLHLGSSKGMRRIHRPDDPHHFMRIKPVLRRVEIKRDGVLLASSCDALRLLEVGRDIYDPVLYLPSGDVRCRLVRASRTSHCPLKGDAVYFDLLDDEGAVIESEIAWSYQEPIALASEIRRRIAFYSSRVTIQESPL